MTGIGDNSDQGVLNTRLFSDGRLHDYLYTDGGPSSTRTTGLLRMAGKEVFQACRHQYLGRHHRLGGSRRADHCRHRLVRAASGQSAHPGRHRPQAGNCGPKKVISTVALHGNTSAASVPLALVDGGSRTAASQRGDLLLLEAMGGGFTWAAGLIRW